MSMRQVGPDNDPIRDALPTDEDVERRARADREVKSGRVEASVRLLHGVGACAVVASEKASIEDFKEGLEARIGLDKKGQQRILWLRAEGSIQNADFDQEKTALQDISALRRASGFVVLGFEGVDFGDAIDIGTNRITSRVNSITTRQDEREKQELRRKRRLGGYAEDYKGKHRRDFGVLFIGRGEPDDLVQTNPQDNLSKLMSVFVPRLALLDTGELAAEFPIVEAPQSGPDEPETGQLNLPIL